MARKGLKREATQINGEGPSSSTVAHDRGHKPVGSGHTLVGSDTTIQGDVDPIGMCDESNQGAAKNVRLTLSGGRSMTNGHMMEPEIGLHVLGRGVKELVQAVQALRHLGVEDLDLPLPRIVVVGDQSTGKSSLIEGMSEIKVPRSAGTCTRCPLEINLTESTTVWNCNVSLSKKYMYEGNLGIRTQARGFIRSEGATRDRPLGPWRPQDTEDIHFATITSKDDVADVLQLAQLATLNPGTSPDNYMPGQRHIANTSLQVKFSPNMIRLDISGPDLPNLSFYDLPGVINVSDLPEESYLVNIVKNLVKEYVRAEDSINLLAMPMTDDPANCSAFRLIRDLKAENRTIGCLTKPDRLQEGESMDQWIEILKGQRYNLGFGYFVIKNNPDPSVDHAAARIEEAEFFENIEPWAHTLRDHSTRFGTLPLQTVLSQRLTTQIQKSLPKIVAQVQQKAENIDAQLRALPEPIQGNLAAMVLGELMKFEKDLQKNIDGGSRTYPFQKTWDTKAQEFRNLLAGTRPVIRMAPPLRYSINGRDTPSASQETMAPGSGASRNTMTIDLDSDDDDDVDMQGTPTHRPGSKRPHKSSQSSPVKLPRTSPTAPNPSMCSTKIQSKNFELLEVRSVIQDAYVGGIPGQIHPQAIEDMVKASMAHWQEPVEMFLQSTQQLCETMVSDQVYAVFGHHQNTRYFDIILEICKTFFDDAFLQQRQLNQRILAWELSKPKTLNDEAMSLARDKAMALLRDRSRDIRALNFIEEQENKTGKFTQGHVRKEKISKVQDKDLKPETFHRELYAMSFVKAFYDIAYSRFVDIICSSIHCEVFGKCRNDLFGVMRDIFRVTDSDANARLAILLASNPADERRRAQLNKEKDTLTKAQERLEGLT